MTHIGLHFICKIDDRYFKVRADVIHFMNLPVMNNFIVRLAERRNMKEIPYDFSISVDSYWFTF